MESKIPSRAAAARRHFLCAFRLNPERHRALLNWKRFNALEAGDVSQRQGSRDGRHGRDVVDGVRIEFTTSLALAIDEWLPRTQVGLYRCLFSTRVCCVWPAACLRVLARVLAHWIKVRARQGGL